MQDVFAVYDADMTMDGFTLFLSVAGAHFLALLSPGVDFVLIVKSGLSKPLSRAFGVALGISAANGLYILLCLAGLASLVAASPALLGGIRIAGGLYLVWLGVHALCSRRSGVDVRVDAGAVPSTENPGNRKGIVWGSEFFTGLGSSVLNPKLPLFYLGLFSLIAEAGTSSVYRLLLGLWMTAVVLVWDSFILFILTRDRFRFAFLRRVRLIDLVSGSILALVGIRVLILTVSGFFR